MVSAGVVDASRLESDGDERAVDPAVHHDARVLSGGGGCGISLLISHILLVSSPRSTPEVRMARVYADVNARLGPSWYDYGEHHATLVATLVVSALVC